MSTMRGWSRLALGARPSQAQRARFASAAQRVLGLGAREADELWARLPHELEVGGLDEAHRARGRDAFSAAGVEVSWQAIDLEAEPCAAHVRLAARETCPRCEQAQACFACLELARPRGCASCARKARRRARFTRVRVAVLLAVLVAVAFTAWHDRHRVVSWRAPLIVGIYPINGDGSAAVDRYIESLDATSFQGLTAFLEREARKRGIGTTPLAVAMVGPRVGRIPPAPPPPDGRSTTAIAAWSLKLRAWVWRAERDFHLPDVQVRMFAIYHAPRRGLVLEHSVGMEKGHVGVAHLFSGADEAAANEVVIAHELLHTAGATDKYDDAGMPVFPDGFAEPALSPRFPQRRAEIMGGRIPTAPHDSKMVETLDLCVVGDLTASEIGWVQR
jgi:hypothetical protein